MKNSNFGLSQFWRDTPLYIKRIRAGMLTFIGGSLIYMPQLSKWTGLSEEDIVAILGIILLGMTAVLSMFGVKGEENMVTLSKNPDAPTPAPSNPTPTTTNPDKPRPDKP